MTIDKAIEILADSAYKGITTFDQDFKDACRLGVEALKVIKKRQATFPHLEHLKLPGQEEPPHD